MTRTPSITIHDTGSAQAPDGTAASPSLPPYLEGAHQVQDASGRTFFLRKLKPSKRIEIAVALGEQSSIQAVGFHAALAKSVVAVRDPKLSEEDNAFAQPGFVSWRDLPGLMRALDAIGDEGLEAIVTGWQEAGWLTSGEGGEADHKDAVKN